MNISRIDAPPCKGGENPLWDSELGCLYYLDNSGKKIHCYNPETGSSRTWEMPSVITTLVLRQGGGAIVTLLEGIFAFDFDTGVLEILSPLPDPPTYIYNDGKVDRVGRFIVGGSTRNFQNVDTSGGLFSFDKDKTLTVLDDDIHVSNGPCFSPDGKTLYFSDSWIHNCYAYDYDQTTGRAVNRRLFVNTEALGGRPDGATVDCEGRLWMAIYGGGKVVAFKPDGQIERVIDMPVKLVSSVMFGGKNLDQLYVTTIAHGAMGEPVETDAGSLYVVEGLGIRGLPETKFAG